MVLVTPPTVGEQSIVISLPVCLCVCLTASISPALHVQYHQIFVHVTYSHGSVL